MRLLLLLLFVALARGLLFARSSRSNHIISFLSAHEKNAAIESTISHKCDHIHTLEYPDDDYEHILGIHDPLHNPSKLQMISAQRLKDVAQSKQGIDCQGCGFDPTFFVSAEDLEKDIKEFDSKFGKPLNLKKRLSATWPEMAIAAEFKKASPSKGDININADAVEQCLLYSKIGAAVISVLTEYKHFKGTLTELKNVRQATQNAATASGRERPAILRKDFILDRYQILEARSHGADTILLIVAILGVGQLQDLMQFSRKLGMEPLVEVHTTREMEIALDCGAQVIGVNNRNLHTFQLDLDTTARAIEVLRQRGLTWQPKDPAAADAAASDVVIAALSGITSSDDVAGFRDIGVGCCLVGETLMKSSDPTATIGDFLAGGRLDKVSSGGSQSNSSSRTIVKMCGMTRCEDASVALQAGANFVGVIFAKSTRSASVDQAAAIVRTVRQYGERSSAYTFSTELKTMKADRLTPKLWYSRCMDLLKKTTIRKPLVVGVFQDQGANEINAIVAQTGIDLVQLHGDESSDMVEKIHAPVIKVLHLAPGAGSSVDDAKLRQQVADFSNKAIAILLDSRLPGSKGGGTGAVFDWEVASSLDSPVLLAGGLTTENVCAAASTQGVAGVDVSSGVEVSPGVKDASLIGAFINNSRQ